MNDNMMSALHILNEHQQLQHQLQYYRYKLYHLQQYIKYGNSGGPLNKEMREIFKQVNDAVRKKEPFQKECTIKHCQAKICKEKYTINIKFINKDDCYRGQKDTIVCRKCHKLLLNNGLSVNNANELSLVEWNNIISGDNKLFEYTDYDNKIKLLQKENKELKNQNKQLSETLEYILNNRLDDSRIVLEVYKLSEFYKNVNKELIQFKEL